MQYDDAKNILKSSNQAKMTHAMEEYSLLRSFSEKLERKKHNNLNSFFVVSKIQEKYRLISKKLGEIKSKKNYAGRQKSINFNKQHTNEAKKSIYINKKSFMELKLANIDKEINEMLEKKSNSRREISQNTSLNPETPVNIAHTPNEKNFSLQRKSLIIRAPRSINNSNINTPPTKLPIKSTNENHTPLFLTPKMVRNSVKRLNTHIYSIQ